MSTATTPQLPAACTGDCEAGTRDCTCGQAIGMWDDERAHPWWSLLAYCAVAVGAAAASAVYPWGVS